jgi:DNA-directed RNA polymerase subunit RPC12/RpoP
VSTLAHEYLKEIINPTCTEKGYTIFTCANCDHTYIGAYTSNLSHDKVVEKVINPTCLNQGYTIYKCNNCNEKFHENYVDALGHNYTENIVHPTCTTNGYTEHTCTRCDSTYKDTYINATGHEYGEYVFDKEAHYKVCSKCNHETEKEQHILEDNKCIVCNFKKIDITVLAGIIGGVIIGIIGLIFLILKKRR